MRDVNVVHQQQQSELIDRLIKKIQDEIKEQTNSHQLLITLTADMLSFICYKYDHPDAQAYYYKWDSGNLLPDCYREIEDLSLNKIEPIYLLGQLVKRLMPNIDQILVNPSGFIKGVNKKS